MKGLLGRPAAPALVEIARVLAAVNEAVPLSRAHKKELPFAVRDLSRMLTAERGDLHRSYWAAPRFLAAYAHYFLPWNLYRLAWLLPGLPLLPSYALPAAAGRPEPLRILDLGSGPLTLPLALWCSRPDLRNTPLHFVCIDTAVQPLRVGSAVLQALWGGMPAWRVDVVREHLDGVLARGGEPFDCILSGNVFNELPAPREELLEERLEGIMRRMRRKLRPGGRVFFLEPGTRLGGKMIALARKGGLANGFTPLAPCTHAGPCPTLPAESSALGSAPHKGARASGVFTGWCHFVHPVMKDIPEDLLRLTAAARLEKHQFSLSCLLLESPPAPADVLSNECRADDLGEESAELDALYQEITAEDRAGGRDVAPRSAKTAPHMKTDSAPVARGLGRVISQPIALPQERDPARYVCAPWGLGLLLNASSYYSGALAPLSLPAEEIRDRKTGALILTPPVARGGKVKSFHNSF